MSRRTHASRRQPKAGEPIANTTRVSPVWTWIGLPVLLVLAIVFLTIRPLADPDTWFHLAFGMKTVEDMKLPRSDFFSHTAAGAEWISSGWFPSVLLAWMWKDFGESGIGLLLVPMLVLLLAFGAAYVYGARRAGGIVALPLFLGLGFAAVRYTPRPDVFSHLWLAALLLVLLVVERVRETAATPAQRRALYLLPWLLPFIMLLWANSHAGFIVGLLIVILHGALLAHRLQNEPARAVASVAPHAAALLAWMINPYGPGILRLAGKIAAIPDVGLVYEWMPLFSTRFPMPAAVYAFGVGLLFALALAWLPRWRQIDIWRLVTAALLLALSLMQRRHAGLAAIGLPILMIPELQQVAIRLPRWVTLAATVAAGFIVILSQYYGSLNSGRGLPGSGINCSEMPCFSSDFLAANPPPKQLFNSYNLGGYLVFRLAPQTPVYIDGRLDVYPAQVWQDMLAVEENRLSVPEMEEKYKLSTWVLGIKDAIGDPEHLASRLAARQDYGLVHFDDEVAVFVKRGPDSEAYLAQHEFRYFSPWKQQQLLRAVQDQATVEQVIQEVPRALDQSGRSSHATAMASAVAFLAGNPQEAQALFAESVQRSPRNLLRDQLGALLRQP